MVLRGPREKGDPRDVGPGRRVKLGRRSRQAQTGRAGRLKDTDKSRLQPATHGPGDKLSYDSLNSSFLGPYINSCATHGPGDKLKPEAIDVSAAAHGPGDQLKACVDVAPSAHASKRVPRV